MITVALTKGRLFKDFISFLKAKGLTHYVEALDHKDRSLFTQVDNVRFIFAKGKDVPTYVENGVADLGIVGLDIITERPVDVLNLSALPFGECRLAVAGPENIGRIRKIATSFPNMTADYYASIRQDVEIVYLRGSVELAPILGLADGIVDIIQTGNTLKANQLVEYETIIEIEARLIANKQTFYTKEDEIYQFINELGVVQ